MLEIALNLGETKLMLALKGMYIISIISNMMKNMMTMKKKLKCTSIPGPNSTNRTLRTQYLRIEDTTKGVNLLGKKPYEPHPQQIPTPTWMELLMNQPPE